MSDYTPTTEQVKDLYHLGALDVGPNVDIEETLAMFDRWLAAHDREVAALAWDEGFLECVDHDGYVAASGIPLHVTRPINPYGHAE